MANKANTTIKESKINNNAEKQVIIEFDDRHHFLKILKENPGVIIIKFSATWCAPCKKIKPFVNNQFMKCSNNVICCDLDIDNNQDLYSFLKKNRQVNGVPALIAWFKGNVSPFSNLSVSGTNENQIQNFFNRCNNHQ